MSDLVIGDVVILKCEIDSKCPLKMVIESMLGSKANVVYRTNESTILKKETLATAVLMRAPNSNLNTIELDVRR